jgi:hypothetical protein
MRSPCRKRGEVKIERAARECINLTDPSSVGILAHHRVTKAETPILTFLSETVAFVI